jgi:NAD(P)-dependent dehydrogenase (short-subunit alcohol dehydrogenase family)
MAATVNNNGVLAGKVAVVTGASRGIGEAVAYRYAMEGAKVVVSARTMNEGEHVLSGSVNGVVQRIRDAGGEALPVQCDLAVREQREDLIKAAQDEFGPVDILVNNGAVTFYSPVETFTEKRWKLMLEVQVYAAFHLAQLVLPSMRERKSGWILTLSSGAAIHPAVDSGGRGGTVYGMCKAALERFSTGLAAEVYEDGIGVNALSPGLVATPGVEYHKLINDSNKDSTTPVEDVAEACLRLSHGDHTKGLSGRLIHTSEVMKEFALTSGELLG